MRGCVGVGVGLGVGRWLSAWGERGVQGGVGGMCGCECWQARSAWQRRGGARRPPLSAMQRCGQDCARPYPLLSYHLCADVEFTDIGDVLTLLRHNVEQNVSPAALKRECVTPPLASGPGSKQLTAGRGRHAGPHACQAASTQLAVYWLRIARSPAVGCRFRILPCARSSRCAGLPACSLLWPGASQS